MFRRTALNVGLVFASLLVFEVFLQIGSRFSLTIDAVTARPGHALIHRPYLFDPVNGYYGNPDFPEHDAWGFRNESVPDRVDIVTIGDSWTYGNDEAAWPAILAELTGRDVYNMGVPGMGAINYLQTFRKIQALEPRLVIVALYFGNDLFITKRHFEMKFAEEVFGDERESLRSSIQSQAPFDYDYLLTCGRNKSSHEPTLFFEIRRWFSRNSKIYGLLRAVKNEVIRQANADESPCHAFSDGSWETVFQSKLRAGVTDLSDVRVQTGMATIRSVISIISSETQNLLVLLLPTKESSFRNRVVKPSASLLELFKNEQSIRTELINFFEEKNINYLDVLPTLQSAEKQPFNVDSDGHPNTYGYEIIARAVNDSLE